MPSQETQRVVKPVVQYLESMGWPVYRQFTGTVQDSRSGAWVQGQKTGTFDILCGFKLKTDGIWLLAYIECKDKGTLSDAQIAFARRINVLGCPWLVCRGVDDLIRWMSDRTWHGADSDTRAVLDESLKFVPKQLGERRGKQKLTFQAANEFDRWVNRK